MNSVPSMMSVISPLSSSSCDWIAARSSVPSESLPAWMTFSFIVARMSWTEFRPPSATPSTLLASPMLESAWAWPRLSTVSFFEIV